MSVLIKDMEMPDNCEECRFDTECGFCSVMPDNFCGDTDGFTKPDWCPLVEVPAPHGRLIDADELMRDISKYHVSDGKFQHWVDVQQTVIEAEEGENYDD